jgi:hypothetical protein
MVFFCLLWVPLFYLLRSSVSGGSGTGGVWALLLGSVTAIVQFFLGDIISSPGGFGFSRWLFGFVDIVSVPVLIPLVLYAFLFIFRGISGDVDFAGFALLWIIPVAALRALSWSSLHDPILLVAVPLVWTALAAGIPFFINWMIGNFRWYSAAVSILCMILLPVAAAAAYWAFFSQQTVLGFLLLFVVNIPMGISITYDIISV